ncbi:hypothetical protein [Peptoniphilus sp. EMRHCC_23]|uniref:DUF1659 domain-containing protein n=1 Tax=Peptoniphilus rachelemmaiella TaxID=2811779 RepID=UPI001C006F33|nr:hypothetical protein [Peptoniphilus rachelemmaiella]
MSDKNKSLRVVYLDTDSAGKTRRRANTYSGLVPDADNEAMKKAAQAIDGLTNQKMTYAEVITNERIN